MIRYERSNDCCCMTPRKPRKPRRCIDCGKVFKSMTEAQWLAAKRVHDVVSIVHGWALERGRPFDR